MSEIFEESRKLHSINDNQMISEGLCEDLLVIADSCMNDFLVENKIQEEELLVEDPRIRMKLNDVIETYHRGIDSIAGRDE